MYRIKNSGSSNEIHLQKNYHFKLSILNVYCSGSVKIHFCPFGIFVFTLSYLNLQYDCRAQLDSI